MLVLVACCIVEPLFNDHFDNAAGIVRLGSVSIKVVPLWRSAFHILPGSYLHPDNFLLTSL